VEASVATLLIVVSAVILASVVIDYTVAVFEETLKMDNMPQLDRIRDLQDSLLNQTDRLLNETQAQILGIPDT
jgi:hypothetical protein